MSDRMRRIDIRLGAICGFIATVPWVVAAVGWAAHWNAYINLLITLGGGVLWFSLIATTMDRYQLRVPASGGSVVSETGEDT